MISILLILLEDPLARSKVFMIYWLYKNFSTSIARIQILYFQNPYTIVETKYLFNNNKILIKIKISNL